MSDAWIRVSGAKRFADSQQDCAMNIQSRAQNRLAPFDTGHLSYGEVHAAALVTSTQIGLQEYAPDLTEEVADAIKQDEVA